MRFLAISSVALLFFLTACGDDKNEYVKRNEALLDQLPVPQDAGVVETVSSPYSVDSGAGKGYGTRVVYQVPRDVTDREIFGFYIERLGGDWRYCFAEVGPIDVHPPRGYASGMPREGVAIRLGAFMRDGEQVGVNTDGLFGDTRTKTYEIGIDHNAYRDFCTGELLR